MPPRRLVAVLVRRSGQRLDRALHRALTRAAARGSLVYCGEHHYQRFYTHSADEFPAAAAQLLATTTTDTSNPGPTVAPALITAEQAAHWAGRPLVVDDVQRLAECIPHSSIPDAIGEIVASWD